MAKTKKSSRKAKPRFDDDDDFVADMKRNANEASDEDIEKQRGKRKTPLSFDNTGIEKEDVNWFKPKHGKDKNRIDIIPFRITQDWYKDLRIPIGTWEDSSKYTTLPTGRKEGQQSYTLIIPIHFDVGTKGDIKLCLREAFGEKCCICDEMFDKISEDKEGNKKIIQRLRPKWRAFYNVIDRKDREKGIQLWDISFHCFEKYLRTEIRLSDEGVTPFASLKEGKTLVFRGTQKKIEKISFTEITSIDFDDRKKPYKTSILDEVFSLDEMLDIPTYEDVRSLFFEEEEGESEEREDDNDENGEETDNGSDDKITEEDIDEMDEEELVQFIEDEDLDIDDPEDMSLSKLRKTVIEEYCNDKNDPDDELPEDFDTDTDGDDPDDEVTKEDINEMDEEELTDFIEEKELDVEDYEDMSLSKLRKAILKEHFGEEEKKATKKKTAKKSDKKKFRRKKR